MYSILGEPQKSKQGKAENINTCIINLKWQKISKKHQISWNWLLWREKTTENTKYNLLGTLEFNSSS